MKIIYLALGYPDIKKTTNLYTDLISEFHKNGNEILVVAPTLERDKIGIKKEGGIDVLRVKSLKLFNTNLLVKGLANILLPFHYKKALKKHVKDFDFDLILMPTPPITLVKVIEWLRKKTNAKTYLILRDIFPQNAIDLKMMKENGLIHKFFRKKELKLYAACDEVGCMSKANVDYVIKHNPKMDHSKLHILPNWENLPTYKEVDDNNEIKKNYGIENKLVIIFGGNIGKPQRMENIIKLAKECIDIKDMVFFIIGSGSERANLENMIASENLKNVILRNQIPRSDYNKLLQIADIGLISLNQDFTIPNFPSKVLSYFSLKIPVLASIDVNTDFGEFIENINAGIWSEAGDVILLKNNLMKLYNDKNLRKEMGQNGHDYMKENLLPSDAYSIIISHV